MLVREREWEGEVQSFPSSEVSIRAGDVDLCFGPSSVRYEGGRYRLEAYSRDRSTRAELELTPVAMPSIVHNVQYGEGSPINWLVVPRLVTSGRLHVGQ